MANTNGNRSGSRPAGSRARSVGPAGNMHPNGAILGDNDDSMWRRGKWKAAAKAAIKPNAKLDNWFGKMHKVNQ